MCKNITKSKLQNMQHTRKDRILLVNTVLKRKK